MSPPRHEYVLALAGVPPDSTTVDPAVRHATRHDAEGLARLMLDAYKGTIDDEGETIVEARDEVARFLSGRPLLEYSWLRLHDGAPVSACLVAWSTRTCPLVSYVMTAAAWKGRGLASTLVALSIRSLADAGHGELRAWITEGNLPSEALFGRVGFRRV